MKRARVFYWVIGVALTAAAIMTSFYLDEPVRDFISRHQNRALVVWMHAIGQFGDWPEHVGLGVVLLATAWWRGQKKWTRVFLSMLVALALAGAAARVVKFGAGRTRPSVRSEQLWAGPRLSSKFYAFPSGHVAVSSAFFATLLLANWRIGLLCVPIPLLIGFARMYVRAHYLSDVLCAAALGILCAWIVARFAMPQIENRQSQINWPAKP